MVQISRELDKQGDPSSMGSHNIEYLRRRDGDLQFREMLSHGKGLSGFRDFPHENQIYKEIEARVKVQEREKFPRIVEEKTIDYDMGLSM